MKKLAFFLLSTLVSVVSLRAADIYWVSFHPDDNTPSANAATAGFTNAPDVGYTQLLRNNGHTVTRIVTSGTPDTNLLNAADLVIISRSVPSGDYELDAETAAWNGITAPTIILGGYVIRQNRLGYMAGSTIPDTAGTVRLRALVPGHPIFAGISLDAARVMVNPYANRVSYTNALQRGISVVTGATAGSGTILATIGTAGDPAFGGMVIGEWLSGATMSTSPADTLGGHRLVLLTGSREASGLTAEGSGIYDLTTDGAQLLLNAVNYMTSSRISIIQVNTTNNVAPGPNETSLLEALTGAENGDYIRFNIPGAGPHYIQTPAGGYPLITKNDVFIDGYTQPGAVPNTNSILAANNAQIKIVLTSTNGNYASMQYEPANPNAGFDDTEFAVLGIYGGTNVTIRGLCLLGAPGTGVSQYGVAIARDLTATAEGVHVNGCWIGVDLDRTSVYGFDDGIAAFSHRDIDNTVRAVHYRHIIGVKPGSANPRSEFNVIVGGTINIIIEGHAHRISGNFLGVLPSGTNDYIVPFVEPGRIAESHIEIGRGGADLVIGTDGDGVNDEEERNIMGGVVTDGRFGSANLGGYRHVVEVYGLGNPPAPLPDRTNNKFAGNYIGVGVDGVTRFTNGVPAFNGSATTGSQYWVGSDFDGVSDAIEANRIFNNYPGNLFFDSGYTNSPSSGSGSHGFFDEPNSGALYSVRGNTLANNYPFPVNPGRDGGAFLTNYINKAVLNPSDNFTNLMPVLSASSTTARLVGTVPAGNGTFPWTILDLYIPDPEGLTNGLVAPDPNLPNGWVQGLTYLGSFVDNGPLDSNPTAGAFDFDISGAGVPADTLVTVSANYSMDPPGTRNGRTMTALFSDPVTLPLGVAAPTLTIAYSGGNVLVSWPQSFTGFTVQSTDSLAPINWTDLNPQPPITQSGGNNVATIPVGAGNKFYRLRQ